MATRLQKIADAATSDDEAHKRIIKQAIREIIDESAAQFGRWALRTLLTAAIGWFVYMWVYLHQGAHK